MQYFKIVDYLIGKPVENDKHTQIKEQDILEAEPEITSKESNDARDTALKVQSSGVLTRMLLNDNKAGMEGLDKEKINQIIFEASKGTCNSKREM